MAVQNELLTTNYQMKDDQIVDLRKFRKDKNRPKTQTKTENLKEKKNVNKTQFSPSFFSLQGLSNLVTPKKDDKPSQEDKVSSKELTRARKEVSQPTIKQKKIELPEIEWSAREFIKPNRGPNWYIYAGLTAIILIVMAFLTKSPIMAITIFLLTGIVYINADKEPNYVTIKLTPKGIFIDDKLYPYNELKSFWLFYDPPERKILSIISQKIYLPVIKIQLENQNPVLVRKYLMRYIPEEEQEESLVDNLAERLKL